MTPLPQILGNVCAFAGNSAGQPQMFHKCLCATSRTTRTNHCRKESHPPKRIKKRTYTLMRSGVPERRHLRRGVFAFPITFCGGIRCDNGWSALCICCEAFVHVSAGPVATCGRIAGKCTNAAKTICATRRTTRTTRCRNGFHP